MATTTFSGPVKSLNGFEGVVTASAGSTMHGDKIAVAKTVDIEIVNGAAAGTFAMPDDAILLAAYIETPTAVPGSPSAINFRLGSAASGQQYVADVDVKGQGFVTATLLYAARNPANTVHYTVAGSGGTAADQDADLRLHLLYIAP